MTELILLLMQLFWHKGNSCLLRDFMSIESYQVKNKEIHNYAFGPETTNIFNFLSVFPFLVIEKFVNYFSLLRKELVVGS